MNEEHMIAIVSPSGAIKREIKRVRKELQKVDDLSYFRVTIQASGRVHDGDVKLTYSLSSAEYGSAEVEGDELQSVLDEMLRRHGWTAIHAPKAIGYTAVPDDDNIPF